MSVQSFHTHRLAPYGFAISGIALLCVMDAIIKAVGTNLPTFQLAFLRFLFGSFWSILAVLILRPVWPNNHAIRINALRGVIGAVTATTFFYSLQTLPLVDSIAFSFLSPLFLAFFGALFLKEKLASHSALGLIAGCAGMLVMAIGQGLNPGGLHLPGVMAAFTSAISYAFGLVLLRQRAQQDPLIIIMLFQNCVPATLLAIPAYLSWQPLPTIDLATFALLAAIGLAGHLLLASAFKRAEASRIAPMEYSALIFGALLGIVFFREWPALSTLLGAGLIMIGTAYAMRAKPAP